MCDTMCKHNRLTSAGELLSNDRPAVGFGMGLLGLRAKEATVTTYASEKAIGGVLSQGRHPVIYVSWKL